MKTEFTQEWKDWIATNVNAGQDRDGIFKILIDEGYAFSAIVKQMNYQPSRPVNELLNPFHEPAQSQRNIESSSFKSTSSKVHKKTESNIIEARHPREFSGNNGLEIDKDQIYIPCLLYTSPSPRDGLLSRMPSSA